MTTSQATVPNIQPVKMHTLGTLVPQTYNFEPSLPTNMIQNWDNIEIDTPRSTIRGFPTPYFDSTLQEFTASRQMPSTSELVQQQQAGVPGYSYRSFNNTNSSPTNFNFTTTPMANLPKSTNTVPYRDGTSSWTNQSPSRSEYRTNMGTKIMEKNTVLRSIRLY